ncbi:D-methionine transport system substrate-binding protein [Lampropedia hyalina DSM 16112]|jgi:D-methionine transport system substrate-binding protein|uniref:D-methionine transport system substrate-binding protein n=1 Tax=Lampropedia hyalina DSM 16112 TaxID=1122156 RepID=A0A1M4V624_9BURK|nr:MetQ/NlpA family ABC transporter substrate-binding protein [Lampropedia hyalina]SHE64370.1 D-methionine transport system substrate-binding protein [Lampropedia hyalina DSM 16112]
MSKTFKHWIAAAATALVLLPAHAADKLRIGVTPGAFADSIAAAVADAKQQGIDVQVVEFTDWTTPNVALDARDIDLNYFQHRAFLDNAVKDRGYKLKDVGLGVLPNIGLYSLRHKSFDDIPKGGKVAIANDPINQGRGLALLQTAGLIKLRDGVGSNGTVDDVVENPRKLSFVEVEGPQLARITNDVDLAQGYPHFIVASKAFDAGSALLYTGIDDIQFALRFVAHESRAEDPVVQKFVQLYQNSDAVKAQIHKSYASDAKLYTLPWKQ